MMNSLRAEPLEQGSKRSGMSSSKHRPAGTLSLRNPMSPGMNRYSRKEEGSFLFLFVFLCDGTDPNR